MICTFLNNDDNAVASETSCGGASSQKMRTWIHSRATISHQTCSGLAPKVETGSILAFPLPWLQLCRASEEQRELNTIMLVWSVTEFDDGILVRPHYTHCTHQQQHPRAHSSTATKIEAIKTPSRPLAGRLACWCWSGKVNCREVYVGIYTAAVEASLDGASTSRLDTMVYQVAKKFRCAGCDLYVLFII